MTERRLYLDDGPGEARGVVTLDGRPERLLICRDADVPIQALGARAIARVRALERASALAFLDLGHGPDAVLNLTRDVPHLAVGQSVEVEIRTEARPDKGPSARLIGPAEGPPRLVERAPSLESRLRGFAPDCDVVIGAVARSVADGAQEEALRTVFSLPAGGSLSIEPTRALVAVDVDLGGRPEAQAKRAARAANLAALGAAARVLRLKGLGGLVVIDLVGRGHDAPVLLAAARAAFGPDNPGVALGTISRFGALELTVPRRARPSIDTLTDDFGAPSVLTEALRMVRALEREAVAEGGSRFEGVAEASVIEAAAPALQSLVGRLGARLTLRPEVGRSRGGWDVGRL